MPFIVWFNFLAGFACVVAGVGLCMRLRWAVWLGMGILAASALAALGIHVFTGGAYETRTVGAMTLRTLVWAVIAALGWRMASGRSGAAR